MENPAAPPVLAVQSKSPATQTAPKLAIAAAIACKVRWQFSSPVTLSCKKPSASYTVAPWSPFRSSSRSGVSKGTVVSRSVATRPRSATMR